MFRLNMSFVRADQVTAVLFTGMEFEYLAVFSIFI